MTTPTQLVLGAGADAVRVAAGLVLHGHTVRLCLTAPELPPELSCVDRASWAPVQADKLDELVGPVRVAGETRLGVVAQSVVHPLPMQPWAVGQMLGRGERRVAARSWLRARARNGLSVVVGGGQEERTYIDWVVRRMGRPAYDSLYADYAGRRWGRSGESLAASVARQSHGAQDGPARVAPADASDHGGGRAMGVLRAAGVEILSSPDARIRVEKGRAVGLDCDGRVLTGPVWTTLAPAAVAQRLADACPLSARHLAGGLAPVPSWRLRLRGAITDLPDEVHVLDPGPCWRYVRAPDRADDWLVSVTGSAPSEAGLEDIRDHARQLGLVTDAAEVVASAALPEGSVVWGASDNARLRPVLEAWQKLGIQAVGRGGTYAELDPTEVVAHLNAVASGAELLEAWRLHVAPPARAEDLDARITQFIAAS